jgi:hypothetical protein
MDLTGPAAAGRTRAEAALPASTDPIYKRIPSLTILGVKSRGEIKPEGSNQLGSSKQQQQQQLSLLSQASWGRLEMKPTENKNKKHKKGTSQRKS